MISLRAERINKRFKGTSLYGVIDWIALLPMLLPLLGLCKRPVNPTPVNPTPNPNPVQAEAWEQAWGLKSAAVDNWDPQTGTYADKVVNRTAAKIFRQKKRDGSRITRDESREAAIRALDDTRVDSMVNIYHDVLEARHAI